MNEWILNNIIWSKLHQIMIFLIKKKWLTIFDKALILEDLSAAEIVWWLTINWKSII